MSPKPILVNVENHFVDVNDVVAVTQVKKNLFVVRLRSQPNMEYPMWLTKKGATALLENFKLVDTGTRRIPQAEDE